MPNVNQRLRKVDDRLSRIDRRLGFLQTRLYFRPIGQDWIEVQINSAVDLGVTPRNLKSGEEVSAHRYSCQVNRRWLDLYSATEGGWAIAPDGINKLDCELEGQSIKDADTFGTLDFRIAQAITVEFPPIPPVTIPPPFPYV
ncbi:MAG: hypothetical protein KME15_19995 [Drouetiella hepatica Uher 2000/2452]|jgi:hypothetical protein|uniref:Uncharacterized protein n=1 Tax=Drouetiella hepatica Uher 2000/2452 TaxID=904376 RepID=A0A951UPL7_9CYAN|nr:hypothetical protein [Drouetiella hepatica Uher 2000/2452]